MTYNEFKNKYNGKYVDYDGAYGAQCWDMAQKYFTECLGLPASVLGGCGLVSNMLYSPKREVLDKYFDEVPTNSMLQGDTVIWEYGHIAVFDNWDGANCWYFSQNPNPCQVMKIGRGGYHAFRLKGSNPTPTKSTDELAREVIAGKYGNGEARKQALGSRYAEVQARVNEILAGNTTPSKSIDELAKEVIRGDWGNGQDRKNRLTQAGYNYSQVQARVNELLK